jgi:hypothetical protein
MYLVAERFEPYIRKSGKLLSLSTACDTTGGQPGRCGKARNGPLWPPGSSNLGSVAVQLWKALN